MSGRSLRHTLQVHAELKSLSLDPDPTSLPPEPEAFVLRARMIAGPADGPGEESFDITVCSPEWLRAQCNEGSFYDARHHLIVAPDQFDVRALKHGLSDVFATSPARRGVRSVRNSLVSVTGNLRTTAHRRQLPPVR